MVMCMFFFINDSAVFATLWPMLTKTVPATPFKSVIHTEKNVLPCSKDWQVIVDFSCHILAHMRL